MCGLPFITLDVSSLLSQVYETETIATVLCRRVVRQRCLTLSSTEYSNYSILAMKRNLKVT